MPMTAPLSSPSVLLQTYRLLELQPPAQQTMLCDIIIFMSHKGLHVKKMQQCMRHFTRVERQNYLQQPPCCLWEWVSWM